MNPHEHVDARCEELLRALGADATPHGERRLLEHLRGVHAILFRWRGDDEVSRAGLFHSIYGTQAFRMALASPADRWRVSSVIGASSESIAYAFGRYDRSSLFGSPPDQAQLIDARTGEVIVPVTGLLSAIVEIEAANMLEQAPPFAHLDADVRESLPGLWGRWLPLLSCAAREDLLTYLRGSGSVTEPA